MTEFLIFVRFFGEISLFFGWGGVILGIFTSVSGLTLAVPLLALGAPLGSLLGKKKPGLRILGLAVSLGALALGKTLGDWLLLVPGFLYVAAGLVQNRLLPSQDDVFYRFRKLAVICLLGGILAICLKADWCFACCMLSLIAYLLLTRMLRHNIADFQDRRLVGMELGLVGGLCGIGLALSSKASLAAGLAVLKWLYRIVFYPILVALFYVLMGFLWVVNWLFSLFLTGTVDELPEQSMQSMMDSVPEEIIPVEDLGANPLAVMLLRLGGIALFLLAVWFVLRLLMKHSAGTLSQATPEESARRILEADRDRAGFAPPAFLDRSPEAAVRRAWASYCRWVDGHSRGIIPSDTTRSVNTLAAQDENPAAAELRQLYLRARYPSSGGLSREDARRAGNLVKNLTKKQ